MSFPEKEGRMWPAHAVLGFMDPAAAAPMVNAYSVTRWV